MENCSKFWFQPRKERPIVEKYEQELNEQNICKPCDDYTDLNRTMIIAVLDHIDGRLYRARLTDFDCDSSMSFKGTACFIDSGRSQKCTLKDIYLFTDSSIEQSQMPPRCFPCRLAEITPSMSNISGGFMWDREAIDLFNEFSRDGYVTAQVKMKDRNIRIFE